jgi:cobalt-zinc-cadmium efflux system outer membrane protein
MRRLAAIVVSCVCWIAAACAPPRSALFDPVSQAVRERTGITPEWRDDWRRPRAVDERIREILAQPLTAEQAALVAVLNSPRLQAEYAELGVAGGDVAAARTPPNPEAELELRFPLEGGDADLELSVLQNVSDLLALIPRSGAADAHLRAVRRRVVSRTIDVAARARIAYYQVAAEERRVGLRRTIAEAASASATLARSLHQAGNITDLDLARETLFEEEATLAVSAAEAEATAARERLNALLGLHGGETGWRIAPDLAAPSSDLGPLHDLERDAVAASLDLEAMRWRIEAAGRDVGVARFDAFFPELGLGVKTKREDHTSVGPLITLSIPIFDWGQGPRARAWARLRRAQHEYTAIAIEVRAAARAARASLQSAHQRVVRLKTRVLPLREKLADEALRQYNAMNLDAFELLVIRREHIEAEEQAIDALRDFWIAQTRVDQLRAGSLPRESHEDSDEEEEEDDE